MTGPDEIKKLASLARISVPDALLPKLGGELDSILAYVGQLESLAIDTNAKEVPELRNVFREDGEPDQAGSNTEKLASQFPSRKGDALSVKQIISHD